MMAVGGDGAGYDGAGDGDAGVGVEVDRRGTAAVAGVMWIVLFVTIYFMYCKKPAPRRLPPLAAAKELHCKISIDKEETKRIARALSSKVISIVGDDAANQTLLACGGIAAYVTLCSLANKLGLPNISKCLIQKIRESPSIGSMETHVAGLLRDTIGKGSPVTYVLEACSPTMQTLFSEVLSSKLGCKVECSADSHKVQVTVLGNTDIQATLTLVQQTAIPTISSLELTTSNCEVTNAHNQAEKTRTKIQILHEFELFVRFDPESLAEQTSAFSHQIPSDAFQASSIRRPETPALPRQHHPVGCLTPRHHPTIPSRPVHPHLIPHFLLLVLVPVDDVVDYDVRGRQRLIFGTPTQRCCSTPESPPQICPSSSDRNMSPLGCCFWRVIPCRMEDISFPAFSTTSLQRVGGVTMYTAPCSFVWNTTTTHTTSLQCVVVVFQTKEQGAVYMVTPPTRCKDVVENAGKLLSPILWNMD
ncbi:hypothetical protein Pelo_13186 [Pelomyxa schiedti]|nr:hypothetical protein Pelo_13186 [Pelomyxa schiedti]